MDARHSIWCCLLSVGISMCGCRLGPDPSVDLLEGELRWMEDQLYMMEDQLEQRCRELAACRRAQGGADCDCSPRGIPMPAERVERRGKSLLPAPIREPDQNRSVPELIDRPTEPTPADPPTTLPPRILLEDGGESDQDAPDIDTDFDLENLPDDILDAPEIELPDPEPQPPGSRPEIETSDGSSAHSEPPLFLREEVEQLHVTAARVSANNAGVDQEKLLIVVEPKSQEDAYIELSAPVKVEIEDANQEGDQAKLGTWDFDAVETGRTFRTSNMGQGIHLALDWPRDVPLVDDLRIVVAYQRLDGKQIRAEKILHPKVQATSVAGWVPVARSRDDSNGTVASAKQRVVTDPFQLAASSKPVKAPPVFQTVPIPVSATENETNSLASWSKPIPQAGGNKLTPIADVALKSIETRVFGEATGGDTTESSLKTTAAVSLETVPIVAETRPAGMHVEETKVSPGPSWTPYR